MSDLVGNPEDLLFFFCVTAEISKDFLRTPFKDEDKLVSPTSDLCQFSQTLWKPNISLLLNPFVLYEMSLRMTKTNNLHMRKQRRRSAVQLLTAQLISTFVFATRIVQFLYYLNPKFQASSFIQGSYGKYKIKFHDFSMIIP